MRGDIQAALLRIKQHTQRCDADDTAKSNARLYPACLRSRVLSCADIPLSSAGEHVAPEMRLVVQYLPNPHVRGTVNAMSRLIEVHGIPELQRVGLLSQGKVSDAHAIAAVANLYNIPVYVAAPDIGGLIELSGANLHESSLGFDKLSFNNQQKSAAAHDKCPQQAIPFPLNDHADVVHGNGTIAFGFQHELAISAGNTLGTIGVEPMPDFVIADMDDGLFLSGICMALAGTGTRVIGAAPATGFWEHAAKHYTMEETREDNNSHQYWEGNKAPMAAIPWETFTGPGNLHGVLEVHDDQMYAASVAAHNQYKLSLQPAEVVPLAVALYHDEFRRHISQAGGAKTSLTVGIILKSRKGDPPNSFAPAA